MTGLSSTFTQALYEHNILIGNIQPVSTTTPLEGLRHCPGTATSLAHRFLGALLISGEYHQLSYLVNAVTSLTQ